MSKRPALVVFSDLDGTLLDHDSYAWDAAKPALDRLAKAHCPVVLTSSKTAPEIAVLQKEMGLRGLPAIVENGAGVIGLEDESNNSDQYGTLRGLLDKLPGASRDAFTGFGDMSLEDVVVTTGLTEAAAQLARERSFSEPGLWSGTDAERDAFTLALSELGITATQGGRFLTLSFGATKADGMARVVERYRPRYTLALGDAPNDITMLEAADFGVIVANPHRVPLPELCGEAEGRISRTSDAGPMGWNTAVCSLLDHLNLT